MGTDTASGQEVGRVGNELPGLSGGRESKARPSRDVVMEAGDGIQEEESQDAQGLLTRHTIQAVLQGRALELGGAQ